jgi:DNA-binding protein H-NS
MARQNLTSMTSSALVKLRHRVGVILRRRANALQRELRSLGEDYAEVGRIAVYGRKKAKKSARGRRKVAAKYRGPNGETWAGRGTRPRWLTSELKKGRKLESFLIDKRAGKRTKRRARA